MMHDIGTVIIVILMIPLCMGGLWVGAIVVAAVIDEAYSLLSALAPKSIRRFVEVFKP